MSFSVDQFASMNDQQLYQIAEYQTAVGMDRKKNTQSAALLGIPLIDSITRASLKEGTLGTKSMTFSKSIAGWAGIFAIGSLYNKGLNAIKNKIPSLKEFEKEHPIMSTVLDWTGFGILINYAYNGLKKSADKIAQKYPNKIEALKTKQNRLIEKIDKSWIEKRIYQPIVKAIENIEKKYPEISVTLKNLLPMATTALVIGLLIKSICVVNDVKDKTEENFEKLKYLQENIRNQYNIF